MRRIDRDGVDLGECPLCGIYGRLHCSICYGSGFNLNGLMEAVIREVSANPQGLIRYDANPDDPDTLTVSMRLELGSRTQVYAYNTITCFCHLENATVAVYLRLHGEEDAAHGLDVKRCSRSEATRQQAAELLQAAKESP